MVARPSSLGLLLTLGGCCLGVIQGTSTGSTGGPPPTCADIVCQAPMICISVFCGPHCGCESDANCPAGQVCVPTVDCGGTCVPPNCGDQFCPFGTCGANGRCCQSDCETGSPDEICAIPSGCDDEGRCVYPPQGTDCGTTCSEDVLTTKTCDGAGGCSNPKTTTCPGNASCTGNSCSGPCNADGGCAINFFCSDIVNGQGICAPGPGLSCNGDNALCSSGACAPNDVCCREKCTSHVESPECAFFACTEDAGAKCVYPPAGILCNVANETCSGSTLHAGLCDGMGDCIDGGVPCPYNYACDDAGMGCVHYCISDLDCAEGFHCDDGGEERGECLQIIDGG